jgi:DNA (cytosine-5)-methyltransferase 1
VSSASRNLASSWAASTPTCFPISHRVRTTYYTTERGHPDPQSKWRSRYWSFLLKLAPDRPSPTIQAQPGANVGPFHWDNRRLRVGEIKALFTLPPWFEPVGSRNSIQAQLGNAVPPLLAQRVAEQVFASVYG